MKCTPSSCIFQELSNDTKYISISCSRRWHFTEYNHLRWLWSGTSPTPPRSSGTFANLMHYGAGRGPRKNPAACYLFCGPRGTPHPVMHLVADASGIWSAGGFIHGSIDDKNFFLTDSDGCIVCPSSCMPPTLNVCGQLGFATCVKTTSCRPLSCMYTLNKQCRSVNVSRNASWFTPWCMANPNWQHTFRSGSVRKDQWTVQPPESVGKKFL